MPTPSARPIVSIAPRATGSPAVRELGDQRPGQLAALLERVARARCPGRRATASDASRTSAEPDATDSRQPQFGQLPWHGRPFISTTMWPISAPPPIQPR